MIIDDLPDPHALDAAVQAGPVRVQRHPALPLRIFNDTEQTVFGRDWTAATRTGRGLEVDDDGRVADGSLGILYPAPSPAGGRAVATRGSFASEDVA